MENLKCALKRGRNIEGCYLFYSNLCERYSDDSPFSRLVPFRVYLVESCIHLEGMTDYIVTVRPRWLQRHQIRFTMDDVSCAYVCEDVQLAIETANGIIASTLRKMIRKRNSMTLRIRALGRVLRGTRW